MIPTAMKASKELALNATNALDENLDISNKNQKVKSGDKNKY